MPAYTKLIIAPYTLYSFIVGGLVSLIWCLTTLCFVLHIRIPKLSLFPEIDITSKVVTESNGQVVHDSSSSIAALSILLSPLSNAGSIAVRKGLRYLRVYVRPAVDHEIQGTQPITLTLENVQLANVSENHLELREV